MNRSILLLLNIKPGEAPLVRKLFTVQFFLGIATAFFFTSTLTMFLAEYKIDKLPIVYLTSAALLFGFNYLYHYYDERVNSPHLLEMVILFATASIVTLWFLLTFVDFHELKIIVAAWYLIIYMLVGYAFWGMASIMFNVRESKRIFSIVGAGDIPAKMLGYFSVSALVHYVSINNLLWVSVGAFIIAYLLMKRYQNQGFIAAGDPNEGHGHTQPAGHAQHPSNTSFINRYFFNRLVLNIALLTAVSYVVFAFVDFTFLNDIKLKFKKSEQIATFIAIFFALGRFVAIGIKLLFSSRMIAKMGLVNSLLVTPILLLAINVAILLLASDFKTHIYIFGGMVLLAEVLRSTLQEPVFFILFQPLKPHDRLRGHLVAKGYTLPFALVSVGLFLFVYFRNNHELPFKLVSQILTVFLIVWIVTIYFIKKQYMVTLINSLQKGYFSGAELFLTDKKVNELLVSKVHSTNPIEVIHSLNLLERSGYSNINTLLLSLLQNTHVAIQEYVLARVISRNITTALPVIKKQIRDNAQQKLNPELIKAFYFLEQETDSSDMANIHGLPTDEKKPAIIGLLYRKNISIEKKIQRELEIMASKNPAEKLLVLDIILEVGNNNFSGILQKLLIDDHAPVYKKAIEAVGKVRDFELFNQMLEVSAGRRAFASLQKSLLFFGDEVFTSRYWDPQLLSPALLPYVIKTAAKIKGDYSTQFLLKLFSIKAQVNDLVIDSLWLKKATITKIDLVLIEEWINKKIEESKEKIYYYNELIEQPALKEVQTAITHQMQADLSLLLKSFALIFDKQKVDRVIELLELNNISKIYNAIEVLELIIPGRFFRQINILVEMISDIKQHHQILHKVRDQSAAHLIEAIMKDTKANFNQWTKAIACYMLPKFNSSSFSHEILYANQKNDDVLLNETKQYVLSTLK